MDETSHADLVITAGDFNRSNVDATDSTDGVVFCRSNDYDADGRLVDSDMILAKARGAVTVSAGPNCDTLSNRQDNLYNQYRLREKFVELSEGVEGADMSITRNPSDHLPLQMTLDLFGSGMHRGRSARLSVITWNVLSQGISNQNRPRNYWNHSGALHAQMEHVVNTLGLLLGSGAQVICLQELGGHVGWESYYNPRALTRALQSAGYTSKVYRDNKMLRRSQVSSSPTGTSPPSLSSIQSDPNSWVMFQPVFGRATLVRASIIDDQNMPTLQQYMRTVSRLGRHIADSGSTSIQIPVVVDELPFTLRVTNVHDNYALGREPTRGMTNSRVGMTFMRDPGLGMGTGRSVKSNRPRVKLRRTRRRAQREGHKSRRRNRKSRHRKSTSRKSRAKK